MSQSNFRPYYRSDYDLIPFAQIASITSILDSKDGLIYEITSSAGTKSRWFKDGINIDRYIKWLEQTQGINNESIDFE